LAGSAKAATGLTAVPLKAAAKAAVKTHAANATVILRREVEREPV
jgi:hypothetical protein